MGYLSTEANTAIREWRDSEGRVQWEHRLRRGGIPVQYRKPLSEIKPFEYQNAVYGRLQDFSDGFKESWPMGKGMMLVGLPGLGKTLLACALGTSLVIEQGFVAAFTTLNNYVKSTQALMSISKLLGDNSLAGVDAREEYGNIKHQHWVYKFGAQLLILDDVGKEYRATSGWAAGEFEALLRDRYYFGLPTIITTNMTVDSWDKEYSESMQSFVEEACPPVELA